ncbi:hypothetical protein [Thermomonospora umbrina]|uniref:Uncharacterized protein n=1 Tax=Thermomonospora umbrina TaxID=111806 RepID=A0A3D9SUA1_9ACTN|nr:hypothetical protein [Thermomonospora umbrina]REE96144.1 hypothetical protein DFJ69_1569 [Thermomonospora umbrina]
MSTDDEKRARLRDLESTLAGLEGELGPPTGEPRDFGDAAEDLQERQERAALLESLRGERDRLLTELSES